MRLLTDEARGALTEALPPKKQLSRTLRGFSSNGSLLPSLLHLAIRVSRHGHAGLSARRRSSLRGLSCAFVGVLISPLLQRLISAWELTRRRPHEVGEKAKRSIDRNEPSSARPQRK